MVVHDARSGRVELDPILSAAKLATEGFAFSISGLSQLAPFR
jgi:hypothetical protein